LSSPAKALDRVFPICVCAPGEKEKEAKTEPTPCASDLTDVKGIARGDEQGFAFGPPPAVTKLSPKRAGVGGGEHFTITGTDFVGVTAVKFGSTSSPSVNVVSPATIVATTPNTPAGVVDVTVTNRFGTSATSEADLFKFAPTVTGVNPNSGPASGGTSVTIAGAGFVVGTTATEFTFAGRKATAVSCTSTTTCTVRSPAHEARTVDVRATVSKVTSAKNPPADQFTYG